MLFNKKKKMIIALFLTYVILNTSASNRFVIFGSPRAGAIVEIDKHAYGLYSGITDIDFATCEIVTVVEEEKEEHLREPKKGFLPLYQHYKGHYHRRKKKMTRCWICK